MTMMTLSASRGGGGAGLAIQILARGQGSDGGGLACDSRQDKRDQKNWFKPLIISYILSWFTNTIM